MAQNQYVKIATPIRKMKSDIGQVVVSLFNDQISMSFQPASGQKTDYGSIKYNGAPNIAPNVRFSVGVAAGIAELIRTQIVPLCDSNPNATGHWEVYACKRGTYESWLIFDVSQGKITMTGVENNNGMQKKASYTFPPTIITKNKDQFNINGEALSLAELLYEIGGANEMPAHIRQYNQAVKDNFPTAGQTNMPQTMGQAQQGGQFMNTWRPQ